MEKNASSFAQKEHYERIHDLYKEHYYDATSTAFRERFISKPLFLMEETYNLLPGKSFYPYFLAEWVKR